jgi:hypothetical protein
MALHAFVFLLVVSLLLSLARLGRLCWFALRPSSSRGGAKRTTLHRLLKPRCPDDCPACRLSCTNPSVVGPVPSPARPWCEVKSRRGAPKRIITDGYACPNQQCAYCGITDAHIHALVGDGKHGHAERIQTFRCQACRTTFTCPSQHCPVPSENPFSPDRHGALCTGRRVGSFGCRTGFRLSTSHRHHLAHSCRRACTGITRTLLPSSPDIAIGTLSH